MIQMCDAVYVGETGKTYRKPVQKIEEKGHIYKHYWETRGHRFYFEDVQVLVTEKMKLLSKLLEGMYTKFNKFTINRDVSVPIRTIKVL